MRIGYCGQVIGLEFETKDNFIHALEKMIDYNIKNGIKIFELSSDFLRDMGELDQLSNLVEKIRRNGLRLVVAQQKPFDVTKTLNFLDALELGVEHKIMLPTYFFSQYKETINQLSDRVKQRLVVKTDQSSISDELMLSKAFNIPLSYCTLKDMSDVDWIDLCSQTWSQEDGAPLLYYTSLSKSHITDGFLELVHQIHSNVDILLEDNLSCIKCMNCISVNTKTSNLEKEWSLYKYSILEKSQSHYNQIRQLLKDKTERISVPFYRLIEEGLMVKENKGQAINTLQHVWGYFKKVASDEEKQSFLGLIDAYQSDEIDLNTVKDYLQQLAIKYKEAYLLKSLYFYL